MTYGEAVRRAMVWGLPAWFIFAFGLPIIAQPRETPNYGHVLSFDLAVSTAILAAGVLLVAFLERRQNVSREDGL